MIKIKFTSNVDFSNSSETFRATDEQFLYKDGRIVKKNVPTLDIVDNWNGEDISVQKTIWDGYLLEFNINESQSNLLPILAACNDIVITDIENNLILQVDNSTTGYFEYETSEYLGQTSNYTVFITFRANKKIINIQEATQQLYYIKANTTYYYSDNQIITSTKEPEIETVPDNNGIEKTTTSDYKQLKSLVFYFDETEKNSLVKDISDIDVSLITLNDGVTVYSVLENVVITPDNLGVDLFKCEVPCVVVAERTYL